MKPVTGGTLGTGVAYLTRVVQSVEGQETLRAVCTRISSLVTPCWPQSLYPKPGISPYCKWWSSIAAFYLILCFVSVPVWCLRCAPVHCCMYVINLTPPSVSHCCVPSSYSRCSIRLALPNVPSRSLVIHFNSNSHKCFDVLDITSSSLHFTGNLKPVCLLSPAIFQGDVRSKSCITKLSLKKI